MADELIKQLGKETRGHIVNEETDDQFALSHAIDDLEEAREALQEAYDKVEDAISPIKGQPATSIRAYFLDKLKIMISSDHGFMTNDPTIDSLIKDVTEHWGPDTDDDYDPNESKVSEDAEEKPSFEPGEKVKNEVGELLTIVGKDGDDVTVEEQPNKVYKSSELVKYVDKEEVVKDENKSE